MLSGKVWINGLLAIAAVGVFVMTFLRTDPVSQFAAVVPPVEHLDIERVEITERGFVATVRADASDPVRIAQVLVDGAYWVFTQDPSGPIDRIRTVRISVDFPWVANEVHHLRFISALGTTFDHTIDVALETPRPSSATVMNYAMLGMLVGFVPVVFGMLFLPAIRSLGSTGLTFVLALTVGMLGYLFVDMTLEGLGLAARASALFGGAALVVIPMVLTLIALLALGAGGRARRDGVRVAWLIAFGIGLHNFGEGLAIGASFAANEAALGAFLVIGFTLHNTTEGIGIVAPLVNERITLPLLASLAMLAGLPAVPGIWIGAFSLSPHWGAVFFGIGAGAVAQVILGIDRFIRTGRPAGEAGSRFGGASVAGYGTGAAIMYGTSLLLTI